MKFIKLAVVFALLAVIYYVISPQVPPIVSVKDLSPVHSFGDTWSLQVTITNYTAQAKKLYLSSSDAAAATSIYIDSDQSPTITPSTPDTAQATLELPPFSHKDMKLSFNLTQGPAGEQQIAGNARNLSVAEGNHSYVIAIGGYATGKQTFGVE